MYLKYVLLIICIIILFINTCLSQNKKNIQSTLNDRVTELNSLSFNKPVISLNAHKFKYFVKNTPRNYTMIIMLTALSSHRHCQICEPASDEFKTVANSWRYSSNFNNQLFFAMVDFDEGSEIFHQLNINTAPVFLYVSPFKQHSYETLDIQRTGFTSEIIAKWIFEKSGIQIRILRTISFSGIIISFIFFSIILTIIYLRRNNLEFLYNRTSSGIISLFIVFVMTSGQMWNHIRGPPLMHKTSKGNIYILNSTNGQYVIETYIVIIYNVAIVIGMILMNEAMKNRYDVKKKKKMIVIGLMFTAIFFSALISIFRIKAHGYPYSLFFK